jgi:SAM-dependent methyltransferase
MSFFEDLYAEHGDSPLALDWSLDGQRRRFSVLYEIGIGVTDSVTDVGCGLGHFSNHLANRGWRGHYTGIDISPVLVNAAAKLHPWPRTMFRTADALRDAISPSDWVVSSGMLNISPLAADPIVYIRRMFEACRKGVAINMLSVNAKGRRAGRVYHDPYHQLLWLGDLTKFVTMRHDYRCNDFTLYLYREPRP